MKPFLVLCLLATFTVSTNGLLGILKKNKTTTDEYRILSNVKIYSNLAEIIQPLSVLPLEFSAEDWSDIRADSVTLVGSNVTITEQTITEKKKSLNNAHVHVRSPSSSSDKEIKFIEATIIDEKRNLVKLNDKDISKNPIYLTVPADHIVYNEEPPQSKYYVNFIYNTTDAVYVSYLRSNLNWKTRYQLNLFDEPKSPILISMANIRNDGESTIHIEHAELLGGDINLQMSRKPHFKETNAYYNQMAYGAAPGMTPTLSYSPPTVKQGEELAGLYVFAIDKPFSIDAKTDYLLPMFRPRVTVERYGSISNYFYGSAGHSKGKAQRSYRLTSDRFLSNGNCIIRESDRLVGETSLPDLAAKDKHEFSLGQDADVIYKENVTLFSSRTYNVTVRPGSKEVEEQTDAVYDVNVLFKNFKKNRSVKIEYEQRVSGKTVKLIKPNPTFTVAGTTIKHTFTLNADEEKVFTHKFEVIS